MVQLNKVGKNTTLAGICFVALGINQKKQGQKPT
jgi:hypothetical protein